MHDEIDTEINGYTRSYYFSLFADLEKEQQSPLPQAKRRLYNRVENKICLNASASLPNWRHSSAKCRHHVPQLLPGHMAHQRGFPPNRCRKCSRSSPSFPPAASSGPTAEPTGCQARPTTVQRGSTQPLSPLKYPRDDTLTLQDVPSTIQINLEAESGQPAPGVPGKRQSDLDGITLSMGFHVRINPRRHSWATGTRLGLVPHCGAGTHCRAGTPLWGWYLICRATPKGTHGHPKAKLLLILERPSLFSPHAFCKVAQRKRKAKPGHHSSPWTRA